MMITPRPFDTRVSALLVLSLALNCFIPVLSSAESPPPGRSSPPTTALKQEQKPSEAIQPPAELESNNDSISPTPLSPTAVSPEAFRQEMAQLRNLLKNEGGSPLENDSVIVGGELKATSRYRQYLNKAADISQELLNVREQLLTEGGKLSLQELGALSQEFTMQYEHFSKQLSPYEKSFQSAQLIETAVSSLDEAIDYWKTSNHYRRWEHGSNTDKADDDEILQLKLQTANTAIGNLSGIVKTRQLFNRSFDLDGN
jgi:hypothetical protein